jgi:SSS family solute:Na+ symporter
LLATLNTVFYFGIVQTLPGFLAARAPRASASGILAGLAAAALAILAMKLAGLGLGGINPGLIGLIANGAVLALWTWQAAPQWAQRDRTSGIGGGGFDKLSPNGIRGIVSHPRSP